jgi:signal transduction histidine kinase
MLLSGRVFDVAGTAKIALGYVVRFGVTLLLLLAVVETFQSVAPIERLGLWPLALVVGLTIYPVAFVGNWITRRFFVPYRERDVVAREAILDVLGVADSEPAIVQQIEHFASGYLAGLEVSVAVHESAPVVYVQEPRHCLALHVRDAWLSPESALYSHRGPELDQLLDWFEAARLGAVVRYTGRKVSIFLFIGLRAGGTRPITSGELGFLHELATIAGTSIDRLRASEENIRSRRLALIGRLAADFSHSARNQISAIATLVEAVRDGREAELSDEYRRAVYDETLALAANHDMAVEITRLEPGQLEIRTLPLEPLLRSISATFSRIAERNHGRMELTIRDSDLCVDADERMLRQVLLNLLRNSVQACAAVFVPPVVEICASTDGRWVHIDVVDSGPGVSCDVYDRLFTPWATTKADGTGLGLAFSHEAMRAVGGNIVYLRPRGAEHAWFRLKLPRAQRGLSVGDSHPASASCPA